MHFTPKKKEKEKKKVKREKVRASERVCSESRSLPIIKFYEVTVEWNTFSGILCSRAECMFDCLGKVTYFAIKGIVLTDAVREL